MIFNKNNLIEIMSILDVMLINVFFFNYFYLNGFIIGTSFGNMLDMFIYNGIYGEFESYIVKRNIIVNMYVL